MGYPAGKPRTPPEPPTAGAAFVEIPEPPAGLSDEELEAWTELRAAVNPKRVTTAADLVAFKLTVQALATSRRAFKALAAGVVAAGDKMDRPSPAVAIMASMQKLAWFGLARFGLTPADRSKVRGDGGGGGDDDSPDAEFGS